MKLTFVVGMFVVIGLLVDVTSAGIHRTNGKWSLEKLSKTSYADTGSDLGSSRRRAQEQMPGPLVDGVEDMGEAFQPRPMSNFDAAVAALMDDPDMDCEDLGLNACEPESWGPVPELAHLTRAICPMTCNVPAEEFCKGDQGDLVNLYLSEIGVPDVMRGNSCDDALRNFGSNELIQHPNGHLYQFCEEPAIGLLCQEACDTNCWSWPPPMTTKVFLPGCMETIAVPTDMHKLMYKNTAGAGDTTICPP
mmetsp:Transcript_39387/g.54713  ORF Transcript_39387/g.54713 Transcript_39387/m.54713 type:complete len:249 (+) Transcript_39387:125-871(+)|eukprot:CAMPEP_0196579248 /NCGR_PEP_ID=MMETSP1081-20130531/19808_1 /TAXON_ID=36882 /ORGANISM="Pyramimonas amylifera, Strain CCMP720" /LENGTH=248 /DNA_ID=CAMNT_0041898765 /DNA_START=117 /DNA_END=863 /DNA_ORIENTATION=+